MNENIINVRLYDKFREFGVCYLCFYRYTENSPNSLFQKLPLLIENEELIEHNKSSTCIVCLGLLQNAVIHNLTEKISKVVTEFDFDCASYMLAIKLPSCIYIREHSFSLYLKSDHSDLFEKPTAAVPYVNLKDVWRSYLSHALKPVLRKTLSAKSPLVITINAHYIDDVNECRLLNMMTNQRKRKNQKAFSMNTINYVLEQFQDKESFVTYFSSPPSVPSHSLTFDSVSILRESIFCAGRYNKWSRVLPQTPWILDGERKMKNSVQELITVNLQRSFKAEDCRFSSSGREDVDVRTLGNGRPFAVELINPRISTLSAEQIAEIERDINKNSFDYIFVRDLQIAPREQLKHLKEGEEHKLKQYCALCVIYGDVGEQTLEKCCTLAPLIIQQKTPIRVLHRRSVAVRARTIHDMNVTVVNTDSSKGITTIKLCITTQAGTYIKEFVHGDFGRTVPNFSELLGGLPVDIVALDVTHIKVDWPPPVLRVG